MKRFFILAACLCPAVFLASCAALQKPPPPPLLYALRPPPACAHARTGAATLSVPPPALPPGFETDRIALYLDGGRRLDYFAGAAWSSGLGDVLQDFIIASGRHACLSALAPAESGSAAWKLNVRVGDFEPVYAAGPDAPPVLRVSLGFVLTSPEHQEAVLDFTLRGEKPARENTLTAVTAGLESQLEDLLKKAYSKTAPIVK